MTDTPFKLPSRHVKKKHTTWGQNLLVIPVDERVPGAGGDVGSGNDDIGEQIVGHIGYESLKLS